MNAVDAPKAGTIWLHLKSKGYYSVVGLCQLEATNRPAVLYMAADGHTTRPWARDLEEFMDGRFASVEPILDEDDETAPADTVKSA